MRFFLSAVVCAAVLVAGGCSSTAPSAPAPVDISRGKYLVKKMTRRDRFRPPTSRRLVSAPGPTPRSRARCSTASTTSAPRAFSAKDWAIPQPSPALIFSYNITPHASGIHGWSADAVATVLASNNDDQGKALCGPMPGGPMGAFGTLTASDALDIGYYVTTLPPIDSGDVPQRPLVPDAVPEPMP